LESEQNIKVSSILHTDTSAPMADADLVMPQAGIPVVDAAPVHVSSSAAAALETSSGAPLLGQPLPELSAQVPNPFRLPVLLSASMLPEPIRPLFCCSLLLRTLLCLQRTTTAASLTPRSSSMAGSDLDCTVFPPSVLAPSLSADSLELSLGGSASAMPIQERIHSAASEAHALAQEAAELKAQAQNYQASRLPSQTLLHADLRTRF
jgi:hypothetical protein